MSIHFATLTASNVVKLLPSIEYHKLDDDEFVIGLFWLIFGFGLLFIDDGEEDDARDTGLRFPV